MFKDFGTFINEGYIFKFEESFVTEYSGTSNIDTYNMDQSKYEDIDSISIKLEWTLQMEVQKDGIYDFSFSPVKAIIDISYLLKYEDDNSPNEYEHVQFELNPDNIEFKEADSFNQVVIENFELDFNKNGGIHLTANLKDSRY